MVKKNNLYSEISTPINLGRRSFYIQQGSVNSDSKRNSLINLMLMPLKKMRFRLKQNPSILSDYIIIGDNPIITLMLLSKISKLKKKSKVSIFFTNQTDYWSYDLINENVIKELLTSFYGIAFNSYPELIEKVIREIFSSGNIEIAIINNHKNLFVNYYSYDEWTKLYFFHLTVMPQSKIGKIHEVTVLQNQIKDSIKNEFLKHLKNIFGILSVNWGDIDAHHPVLISSKILLTSIQHGWLNFDSQNIETLLHVRHDFSDFSFGSAKRISHRQEDFLNEVNQSLIDCINYQL